jgi:uncharacterized metal-binding protein
MGMASGKTHDWFTWVMAPVVWGLARFGLHFSHAHCLLIFIGTLIGGLLLSPDLDTRSRPFYRWGPFRFIWWPYQWMIRHRSPWSHGLFLASWLRLLYLSAVLSLLYCTTYAALRHWFHAPARSVGRDVFLFLHSHLDSILWLGVGLWVGALLHIVLDHFSSALFSGRKRR